MKNAWMLISLLGVLPPAAPAQTSPNRLRLFDKATKYFEGYRFTDTSHGAEILQGFPASHFQGLRTIAGVSFTFFDTDRSFVKVFEILLRRGDGKGGPDLSKPPLFSMKVSTKKFSGAGPAYPFSYLFPKPFHVPAGTRILWVGVRFGPDPSPRSQVWFGALAKRGKGGRPGVLCRKGVPNPRLAWQVPYSGGKPLQPVTSDDYWVWTIGILTTDPILLPYIKLNADLQPHQGPSIAGKVLTGMAAMWPDIRNAEGLASPGRRDLLGWKVVQNLKKSQGNTLTAFVFLQDHLKAPGPFQTPYGPWFLGLGGPFATTPPLWSPLTNGTWSTPPIQVPPAAASLLAGTRLFAQAVLLETDPAMKIVGVSLSNAAAMDL